MTEMLVELVRTLENRPRGAVFCCPDCGSFLDAPRTNPLTGDLGRKCVSCRDWWPVEARLAHDPLQGGEPDGCLPPISGRFG